MTLDRQNGFQSLGPELNLMTQIRIVLLKDNSNGTRVEANIPIPDNLVGKIQYKAMLGTINGAFPFTYPTVEDGGNYYEIFLPYRANFGSAILSVIMFLIIASFVWGGLGSNSKSNVFRG